MIIEQQNGGQTEMDCIQNYVNDSMCKEILTVLANDTRQTESRTSTTQSALHAALQAKAALEEHAENLQMELNRVRDELLKEKYKFKRTDSLRQELENKILEQSLRLDETKSTAMVDNERRILKLAVAQRVSIMTRYQCHNYRFKPSVKYFSHGLNRIQRWLK